MHGLLPCRPARAPHPRPRPLPCPVPVRAGVGRSGLARRQERPQATRAWPAAVRGSKGGGDAWHDRDIGHHGRSIGSISNRLGSGFRGSSEQEGGRGRVAAQQRRQQEKGSGEGQQLERFEQEECSWCGCGSGKASSVAADSRSRSTCGYERPVCRFSRRPRWCSFPSTRGISLGGGPRSLQVSVPRVCVRCVFWYASRERERGMKSAWSWR